MPWNSLSLFVDEPATNGGIAMSLVTIDVLHSTAADELAFYGESEAQALRALGQNGKILLALANFAQLRLWLVSSQPPEIISPLVEKLPYVVAGLATFTTDSAIPLSLAVRQQVHTVQ